MRESLYFRQERQQCRDADLPCRVAVLLPEAIAGEQEYGSCAATGRWSSRRGLVVLRDFANNVPYVPQSTTAPCADTALPVVGPDGAAIRDGLMVFLS